jgi:type II secretory ATPase GspE/PulE/Tfp pilus assembly ATPase PilB-like protein
MKIWTAEDPVEITQKGMRQVQMAPKIGLTFATALRAFLRADPDVVMVGEMRDHETASIGVEASLTGHIVFSTLHTNSAPETITRLIDMGLDPFSFADALLGVLAQRLARRLCSGCKSAYEAPKEEVTQLADLYGVEAFHARFPVKPDGTMLLYRSSGCEACGKSGYKGRVPLHELLVNNEGLKTSIAQKLSIEELRKSAIANGMTTLLQDGIAKCVFGHTDVKQVLAVAAR